MNLSYITAIQGYGGDLTKEDVPIGYYTLKEYCRTTGISKQKIRYALNMDRVESKYFIKDGYNYFIRKDFIYIPPTLDVPEGYLSLSEYCVKYRIERYTIYYALYHGRIESTHYIKQGRNYYIRNEYNYKEDRLNIPEGYMTVSQYCRQHNKKRSSIYYYLRIMRIPESQYLIRNGNYFIKTTFIL